MPERRHWWLTYRGHKIDFTGDQFGGPMLVEVPPGLEADIVKRVGEKIRGRLSDPSGNCFDCSVAAGILLAAEGVHVRLRKGTVGPDGEYREESAHSINFDSLAGFLGMLN